MQKKLRGIMPTPPRNPIRASSNSGSTMGANARTPGPAAQGATGAKGATNGGFRNAGGSSITGNMPIGASAAHLEPLGEFNGPSDAGSHPFPGSPIGASGPCNEKYGEMVGTPGPRAKI